MPHAAILCVDDEPVVLRSLRDQVSKNFGSRHQCEIAESVILERSGDLVATSAEKKPFLIQSRKPERLAALDSRETLTRKTTQHLLAHFGCLRAIREAQPMTFKVAGKIFSSGRSATG